MESYSWIICEIESYKNGVLNNEVIRWNNKKLMELYSFVYKKCIDDKSVNKDEAIIMYEIHEKMLTEFIIDCLVRIPEKVTIPFFLDAYEKYQFFCNSINFIFRYLNKFFILKFKSMPLEERSLNIFMKHFFTTMDDSCSDIIYKEACKGYPFSKEFIQDFSNLLGCYHKFELKNERLLTQFKNAIRVFYQTESHSFVSIDELIDYYKFHQEQLKSICEMINYPQLMSPLMDIFLDSIHTASILISLKKEFSYLAINKEVDKLFTLYNIHSEFFIQCMILFIEELCSQSGIFPKILDFYNLLNQLAVKLEDSSMIDTFKTTLTGLIKNLSNFDKTLSMEIYNNKEYCFLLQMLENKDTFVVVYGKILLNRLLVNEYLDTLNEMVVLEEMKKYISNSLMYKLESLILDYRNAALLSRKFQGKSIPKSHIFVFSEKTFLTQPFTLSYSQLPKCLESSSLEIIEFYTSQYNLRNLTFNYWQSNVTIESTYYYPTRNYTMNMSVIQYIILSKIQKYGSITQKHLVDELELDSYIVSAVLHSLSNSKTSTLLLKSGIANKLDTINDRFTINKDFTSNQELIRFKLPILNSDEKNKKDKISDFDIPYLLRAKIVKTIKHEQEMTRKDIENAVSIISSNVKIIDQQIDYLVTQEYIEINNDIFSYIP